MGALVLSGNTAKLDGINMGITYYDNRISLCSNAINIWLRHGNNMTKINHLPMGVKNGSSQIIPKNIFFRTLFTVNLLTFS
jgi:hypothetical protein